MPRAIVLAGQPGAGKGGLVTAVEIELSDDVVKVDPDELRGAHPDARLLRQQHPYTWAGHTLFVVQGEPSDPAHQRAAMPTELAAQTSVEESMQQFDAVSREAHQRAIANQLEQQLEDQRVQQDIQIRTASMG